MKTPREVRAPGARWHAALGVLLTLVAFGNAFLIGCGGKSQNSGQAAAPPAATPAVQAGAPAAGEDPGAKVYTQRCVLCHGPEGKGNGTAAAGLNPKPRNHTDGSYMNGRTNEQLLEVIRNGKGAMPPWGKVLSDEEVHAALRHVRSLARPPYKGPMP